MTAPAAVVASLAALATVGVLGSGLLAPWSRQAPDPGTATPRERSSAGPAAAVDGDHPAAAAPSPRPSPSAGPWRWPVAAPHPVLHRFEAGRDRWSPAHRGVDLGAAVGAPVHSAGPGVVVFAGALAGRGVVVVQHGADLRTTYEPVAATVRVGAVVAAGAPIGHLTAATGGHCAGAACLHWGAIRRAGPTGLSPPPGAGAARAGEWYVDPLLLLPRRRPILLPPT